MKELILVQESQFKLTTDKQENLATECEWHRCKKQKSNIYLLDDEKYQDDSSIQDWVKGKVAWMASVG